MARNLTLGLTTVGILAHATPAAAKVGLSVCLANSYGDPMEVQVAQKTIQGTLSLEELMPGTQEASENAIEVDSESLQFLGTQSIVVGGKSELRLTLDHQPGTEAAVYFWVKPAGKDGQDTYRYAFKFTSDLTDDDPEAWLFEYRDGSYGMAPFKTVLRSPYRRLELGPRESAPAPSRQVAQLVASPTRVGNPETKAGVNGGDSARVEETSELTLVEAISLTS